MNEEIDTSLLDELSQQFLRAVKLSRGADVSKQVLDALEGPLGKEWKNRVVLNKLAGTYQTTSKISFRVVDEKLYKNGTGVDGYRYGYKINAIKELRAMSGVGLAKAKQLIEASEFLTQVVELNQLEKAEAPNKWEKRMLDSIMAMRSFGFEVHYA